MNENLAVNFSAKPPESFSFKRPEGLLGECFGRLSKKVHDLSLERDERAKKREKPLPEESPEELICGLKIEHQTGEDERVLIMQDLMVYARITQDGKEVAIATYAFLPESLSKALTLLLESLDGAKGVPADRKFGSSTFVRPTAN